MPTVSVPTETPTTTGKTSTPAVNTFDTPFDFDPSEYLEAHEEPSSWIEIKIIRTPEIEAQDTSETSRLTYATASSSSPTAIPLR
jgi:hypothetical protein